MPFIECIPGSSRLSAWDLPVPAVTPAFHLRDLFSLDRQRSFSQTLSIPRAALRFRQLRHFDGASVVGAHGVNKLKIVGCARGIGRACHCPTVSAAIVAGRGGGTGG